MPIPFLLIGIGAAAAATGVGKTVKAGIDQSEANDTNSRAKNIIDLATESINVSRKNSGDAITNLGHKKIWVLNHSIKPFIISYEKLHNVDLTDSEGLDELQKFSMDEQSFGELREMEEMASSLVEGIAGGVTLGAITAFGAYGGAMAFGAASTGTAIASLSGVAASNATLAFLGGGALSAGGLGMAGGTAVLGGLVAGPALAVLGFVVGAKASANKDAAYANLAKAEEFSEEMKTAGTLCEGIRLRANLFDRLIIRLNAIFEPLVYSLEQIIATTGVDYSGYTLEQKHIVAEALIMAGTLKAVLDVPILTKDGELAQGSEQIASDIRNKIEGM